MYTINGGGMPMQYNAPMSPLSQPYSTPNFMSAPQDPFWGVAYSSPAMQPMQQPVMMQQQVPIHNRSVSPMPYRQDYGLGGMRDPSPYRMQNTMSPGRQQYSSWAVLPSPLDQRTWAGPNTPRGISPGPNNTRRMQQGNNAQ